MPRKKNALPSYLLHTASGQARVRIAGREYLLGPYGSEESRIKYGTLISQAAGGLSIDPLAVSNRRSKSGTEADDPGPSVAELIVAFLNHAETHYVKNGQPTSEQSCIRSAVRPLRVLYGLIPAKDFGPLALKAVRAKLVQSGVCRTTVNGAIGRIRHVFRHAVANEMVPVDVLKRLETVSPLLAGRTEAHDNAPRHALDQADIDAVREHVTPLVRDLIDLQLLTGTRSSELLALTTSMIDRTKEVWFSKLADHKCTHHGQSRTLHFGPKAQLILAKYLLDDPRKPLFKITRKGYCRAITRVCDKHEITRWSPHWLRHTAATRVREQLGIENVQSLLGHSTAEMSRHYSAKMDSLATATAAACG